MDSSLDELLKIVVCPRDKLSFRHKGDFLVCANHHRYRVIEGIPILLVAEAQQTHIEGDRALLVAEGDLSQAPLLTFNLGADEIDPFVKNAIGATNGSLYQHLVGTLKAYPIPDLRIPPSHGDTFLEIGCSWGRWTVAAARKGYRVIGIDPSLKGVLAARRVCRQLGIDAHFLVADGRFLPFSDGTFGRVFSYSVLQHLSKENVRITLPEIRRVLKGGGEALVQMPNVFGLRCLYHEIRRGFRETQDFEVRYWTIPELKSTFSRLIGPVSVSVDGYFSLNAQVSDVKFLPGRYRAIVYLSELLRRISTRIPALNYVADSLYVSAVRLDAAPSSR
jgi:SAM-dependent methyltransferase